MKEGVDFAKTPSSPIINNKAIDFLFYIDYFFVKTIRIELYDLINRIFDGLILVPLA